MDISANPIECTRWDQEIAVISLRAAISGEDGFVKFLPAELSPESTPLLVYPGMQLQEHLENVHRRRDHVPSLGCTFLHDVIVREHMLSFKNDRLLIEGSHLSDVSIEWSTTYSIREDSPERDTVHLTQPIINALGPGYLIYGHWIVDFIPRIAIARAVLKDHFPTFKILIPNDAPSWVYDVCRCVLNINRDASLEFDPVVSRLACQRICFPTYAHGVNYGFHPYVREIFWPLNKHQVAGTRKLCISRKNFENGTSGVWKIFDTRYDFEAAAIARGFEIVYPEKLSLEDQIAIFSEAKIVIGEYGSALHNSVFAGPGTVIGCVRCLNSIQSTLAATFHHQVAYLLPDVERVDDRGVQRYACRNDNIDRFLDFVNSSADRPVQRG